MEKQILLELHYLPTIQYVTKLLHHPIIWLEQHENYSKGSYRNRCHLASSQGLLRLSIPLVGGKHQQQSIRDVQISNVEPWQSQHWTAIKSAYGKSPFFEYYADAFLVFYKKKYTHLWEWNWDLLHQILAFIPFDKDIRWTERFEKDTSEEILDFRNLISPKAHKNQKDSHFSQAKYVQVFEENQGFIPNLSILDLLFCMGPEAIIYLENSINTNSIL